MSRLGSHLQGRPDVIFPASGETNALNWQACSVSRNKETIAMIEVDLSNKTDNQIEIWIQNYEKRHATGEAFYKKLLEERAKRQTRGLKLEVSLQNLIVAAKARQFVTYGDLAKASEGSVERCSTLNEWSSRPS